MRSKDVLLVMASGNDGVNVDVGSDISDMPGHERTPGGKPDRRGALTPDRRVASFSNYERKMWICSPPEKMYDRPLPRADTVAGANEYRCADSLVSQQSCGVSIISAREIREILIRTVTHFPWRTRCLFRNPKPA